MLTPGVLVPIQNRGSGGAQRACPYSPLPGVCRRAAEVALGLLLVGGLIVLGHTILATAVSVLFIGWLALIAGIVAVVAALFRIRRGGFWSAALTGGLLTVLGLMFLRHPGAAAVTLTLLAGSSFLASGTVRLVAAAASKTYRWPLVLGGIVSAVLGLIVLFNLFTATFVLLGVLLGVQILIDGVTLLLEGRLHVTEVP